MKLDYVDIPMLLQITPRAAGPVRPVFVVGPVVGFKTSANFAVDGGGSADLGSAAKSTTFGGVVGVGMRIRTVEGSGFLLQARFQAGFSNLLDDPTIKLRAQDIAVLAGYSFGL